MTHALRIPMAVMAALVLGHAARAEEGGHAPAKPKAVTETEAKLPAAPKVKDYCINFSSAAAEARYAWQHRQLAEMIAEIDAKVAVLDQKRAELEAWRAERDRVRRETETGLVEMLTKMRPDVAAQQFALLDLDKAAVLLAQMNPRKASAILNEMDGETAARLTDRLLPRPAASAPKDKK